jgi:hypothetical protein
MQDRELVAAIVAGDPDGLAEAYGRYAAPLYAYCRFMLPDPHPPGEAPSPSPSPSPTPGTLRAVPNQLVLSAVKGKAASGTFILTAVGGPVNFVITSPNGKVTVSPPSGSLKSAGSWVTVTVTVRSLVAVNARLTVEPGNLIITVEFSIKV